MEISEALSWNDLANEYDKSHTGRPARTLRMETVFDWAEAQTEKFYVHPTEGTIHRVVCPTKHAPDAVESVASVSISPASEVSVSEAESTPTTTQVM